MAEVGQSKLSVPSLNPSVKKRLRGEAEDDALENKTGMVLAKAKAGRPSGSVNRHSEAAIRRLIKNGFDPIDEMIETYEEIKRELEALERSKYEPVVFIGRDKKERKIKYSHMAYATLLALKQKVAADLIRYGYARVPETVNVDAPSVAPLVINLTPKGEERKEADNEDVIDDVQGGIISKVEGRTE